MGSGMSDGKGVNAWLATHENEAVPRVCPAYYVGPIEQFIDAPSRRGAEYLYMKNT